MALRIGELLLQKNLINQKQLDMALEEQAKSGTFLGESLVSMGFVTEDDLLKVLAEQFNTRFVSLERVHVNPAVLKLVPQSLAWEYRFFPIEMRASVMLIAVSNPLDMWPMSVVQEKLDLAEVQIVLAKKDDIMNAIVKYYGPNPGGSSGGGQG